MSERVNASGGSGGASDAMRRQAEMRLRALDGEQSRRETERLSATERTGVFLICAGLVAGWAYTFVEMWKRWFPAWERSNLTLMERLTEGDSYYTHGPLVPLTCLVIAFFIHRRVGFPIHRTRSATTWGWVLFGGSLLVQLIAARAGGVNFVSGFALIGAIGGLVLILGGWPLAKAYAIPIALLVFMVPLSMGMIAGINYNLKYFAARCALWITTDVFDVPAYMQGAMVHLQRAPDGTPKWLVVENVCGGLRSLISLTFFAALFAAVCRVTKGWRLFLLLMAVPVAIFCNIIRITSLNLVAHYHSVKEAGPGGGFHDLSGVLIFVLALSILFGLEWLIILFGKLLGRKWMDNRLLGFLDNLKTESAHTSTHRQIGTQAMWCGGLLAVVASLSIFFLNQAPGQQHSDLARKAVPATIHINGATLDSEDQLLDEQSLTILQTRDYVYRYYTSPQGRSQVNLLIVFSSNNRKGTHEPEVCIEGGGAQIVSKRLESVDVPGVGLVSLRELFTQTTDGRRRLYFYVYKAGDTYTTRFWYQQAVIFGNGLVSGNSAGALVRFDVAIQGEEVEAARELARGAIQALMPEIDRNLP